MARKKLTYHFAGLRLRINKRHAYLLPLLKEAEVLLTYGFDWADGGDYPLQGNTWRSSIRYLYKLSQSVFKKHNKVFTAPYINLCPDGSLDFHFENDKYTLLINFSVNGKKISWYGYDRVAFMANPKADDIDETKGVSKPGHNQVNLINFFKHFVEPIKPA